LFVGQHGAWTSQAIQLIVKPTVYADVTDEAIGDQIKGLWN